MSVSWGSIWRLITALLAVWRDVKTSQAEAEERHRAEIKLEIEAEVKEHIKDLRPSQAPRPTTMAEPRDEADEFRPENIY